MSFRAPDLVQPVEPVLQVLLSEIGRAALVVLNGEPGLESQALLPGSFRVVDAPELSKAGRKISEAAIVLVESPAAQM